MAITVGLALSGVGSGVLLTKLGRYRWVLVQGWVLMILRNGSGPEFWLRNMLLTGHTLRDCSQSY